MDREEPSGLFATAMMCDRLEANASGSFAWPVPIVQISIKSRF
jgi:hypothetical protein